MTIAPDAPHTDTDPGTDLERHETTQHVAAIVQGTDVPSDLQAMMSLADVLARSAVIPRHWQRPENIVSAMLAARSLDIPLWPALMGFHVIEGRLGMEATMMRALLLKHGGGFKVIERGNDKAVVSIRRPHATEWVDVEYLVSEADHLLGKTNWKQNRRAMLVARATTRGIREQCADLLMGFNYSPEELEDEARASRRISVPATVTAEVSRPAQSSNVRTENPWVKAVRDADTLDAVSVIRKEAQARGLLDAAPVADGPTLGDMLTARAGELARAARQPVDVTDADVLPDSGDPDSDPDDGDVLDVEPDADEFTGELPAVATLPCGCDVDTVYATGTHDPACPEYTAPQAAQDRRSRR